MSKIGDGLLLSVERKDKMKGEKNLIMRKKMIGRKIKDKSRKEIGKELRRELWKKKLRGNGEKDLFRKIEIEIKNRIMEMWKERKERKIGNGRKEFKRKVKIDNERDELLINNEIEKNKRRRRKGMKGIMDERIEKKRKGKVEIGIGKEDMRRIEEKLKCKRKGVIWWRRMKKIESEKGEGKRNMVEIGMLEERRKGLRKK